MLRESGSQLLMFANPAARGRGTELDTLARRT
jgi:hypothetical protein